MKKISFLLLTVLLCGILSACQAAQSQPTATTVPPTSVPTAIPSEAPTGTPTPIPQPVLTITGSQTVSFTMEDIRKLPAAEGLAGIKSSTGKITAPAAFKGVLLTDLLALAGGADSTMGVQVEASDGYAMTLSYDQITQGQFITYDPGTGDEVTERGALQAILAYEMEGQPLDVERDGNFRLMVISEKPNQVVDGHWAVKFVTTLTLKPLAADWTLSLEGVIPDEIDRGSFESCTNSRCHAATWVDEKAQTWTGSPLYLFAGRVDDENKHEENAFNGDLAQMGYLIELIAEDGYSVTLDSARVMEHPEIMLAFQVNGNPLTDEDFPLRLVGPGLSKKEMAGKIVKIVVHIDPAAILPTATPEPTTPPSDAQLVDPNAAFNLIGAVETPTAWSLDELNLLEVVKLSVEHPKKGTQEVEGVRLNALLDMVSVKADAKTLVLTAGDGYSIAVDLAAVRACADCLVAFDGEGGLKSVMPGMESGLWVKDLDKIEVQ